MGPATSGTVRSFTMKSFLYDLTGNGSFMKENDLLSQPPIDECIKMVRKKEILHTQQLDFYFVTRIEHGTFISTNSVIIYSGIMVLVDSISS